MKIKKFKRHKKIIRQKVINFKKIEKNINLSDKQKRWIYYQ